MKHRNNRTYRPHPRGFHPPFLLLLLLPALYLNCLGQSQDIPRNIIYCIGDGMGVAQVSAYQLRNRTTNFERFPVAGFSLTASATNLVTESAAGGTALSTGRRARNGVVSVDSADRPMETLLERARACGKSVGVVVTSSLTHATPAAFLAHAASRKEEFEIAEQIAASRTDVLIGGGRRFFLPKGAGGDRTDGRNLLAGMAAAGYTVADALPDSAYAAGPVIVLSASEGLPAAAKRDITLARMVRTALGILGTNPNGFVLMIEGSQIDWAAHDNDLTALLAEMRDFDGAIGEALDYAGADGSTLVVVTADHETGGLTLDGTKPDGSDLRALWAHGDHSASMVPLFASGPGERRFGGIRRNDEIARALFDLLDCAPAGMKK